MHPKNGLDAFMGGWHVESLSYAIWEQLVGFSLIIRDFRDFLSIISTNRGNLAKALSDGAYGVYILHPPIIVGVSAIFPKLGYHCAAA